MSCKKITKELLTTYRCVRNANSWISVREIAEATCQNNATINRHLRHLVKSKTIEVLKEMNYYIYRPSSEPSELREQLERLLGISLSAK